MKNFLQCVAEGYASQMLTNTETPPEQYLFVFPNKRAGTFFLKELRRALTASPIPGAASTSTPRLQQRVYLSPGITSITDLVAQMSGRLVETRINLIFMLYRCYCDICRERVGEGEEVMIPTFESFRRWGETVLADFSEIDMHLAHPEELYKNLADFRTITSTFLTEEQLSVIEEYFGYRMPDYDSERFWMDFGDNIAEGDVISKIRRQKTEDRRHNSSSDGASNFSSDGATYGSAENTPRKKFIRIWKVLYPLYIRFNAELERRGITTQGGAYRLAVEALEQCFTLDTAATPLIPGGSFVQSTACLLACYPRIVFIGFNALSGAERRLFTLLQKRENQHKKPLSTVCCLLPPFKTEFIWDATGPVISDPENSAGRFVTRNARRFPAPAWIAPWLAQSDAGDYMPEITAIASPSKVMQVKIASSVVTDLRNQLGEPPFREARVALVLPDENLLLPMLHSLPPNVSDVNLTMGYPLKLTAVGSFLALLRRMQMLRRDSSRYLGYSYEEVTNLLAHPYAQQIIGAGRIGRFRRHFERKHISVVKDSDLQEWFGEAGERMLSPIPTDATSAQVLKYIDDVLALIGEHFVRNSTKERHATGLIEVMHLEAWRDALRSFADSIAEFKIAMSPGVTMAEAYRLLSGETVAFEGEPLTGLQIMGMLETRALDFEEVVITSVNERILPQRVRRRSFIPNVIRRGYGLPPMNHSESLFAYYFYRLLSRARRVTLIYDSRTSGLAGGVSRYLMQLRYLFSSQKTEDIRQTAEKDLFPVRCLLSPEKSPVKEIEYRFNPQQSGYSVKVVEKTPDLMALLERYTRPALPEEGRQKNISASLLKKYLNCPIKFYLYALENISDDPLPTEGVGNIAYGNIIHKAMEELYLPPHEVGKGHFLETPIEITEDFIDARLDDEEGMYRLVRKLINRYHYDEEDEERELQPDTELVAQAAMAQLQNLLTHDRTLTPFHIYGCEIDEVFSYESLSGKRYNIRYAIDRMDDAAVEQGVRIVDYKTGGSYTQAANMEQVFGSSYEHEHLFQLLFYTLMLNERRRLEGKEPLRVTPVVYPVAKILNGGARSKARAQLAGEVLEQQLPEDLTEFREMLEQKLEELYDPAQPFMAQYTPATCHSCPFAPLCRS